MGDKKVMESNTKTRLEIIDELTSEYRKCIDKLGVRHLSDIVKLIDYACEYINGVSMDFTCDDYAKFRNMVNNKILTWSEIAVSKRCEELASIVKNDKQNKITVYNYNKSALDISFLFVYYGLMKDFRDKRRIKSEEQWKVLHGQLEEELNELKEAKTKHDIIDAIADIIVFMFNCAGDYTQESEIVEYYLATIRDNEFVISSDDWQYDFELIKEKILDYVKFWTYNGYRDFHRQMEKGFTNDPLKTYKWLSCSIGRLLGTLTLAFEVYPDEVMLETYYEISRRLQDPKQKKKWDKDPTIVEKWQKDKNQDPETLYKANYNNAKIRKCDFLHTEYGFSMYN